MGFYLPFPAPVNKHPFSAQVTVWNLTKACEGQPPSLPLPPEGKGRGALRRRGEGYIKNRWVGKNLGAEGKATGVKKAGQSLALLEVYFPYADNRQRILLHPQKGLRESIVKKEYKRDQGSEEALF